MNKPPVGNTRHMLPFERLSGEEFERLIFHIVFEEKFQNCQHIGALGGDGGRDVQAERRGERWVFQCKNTATFHPGDARAEVKKIRALPAAQQPDVYVFLVRCRVTPETRDTVAQLSNSRMRCEIRAYTELDAWVKSHPKAVAEFFGENIPRKWWMMISATLALLTPLTFVAVNRQEGQISIAKETLKTVDELRESELAEIDKLRRELQETCDELRETQLAVASLGIYAVRAAVENPKIEALGNRIVALVDSFKSEYDMEALSDSDYERLAFAQAVQRNAAGLYDEALTLVTEEMAASEIRAAEEQADRAYDANMIRANALYGKGSYRKALEHVHRAERWRRDNLSALWLARMCHSGLNEHSEVLLHDNRLVPALVRLVEQEGKKELANNLAMSRNNRGTTYHALRRYDEALEDYAQAITILKRLVEQEGSEQHATNLAINHSNRGAAYQGLGRYDEALKDYAEAIAIGARLVEQEDRGELNDALADIHRNRGTAYHALGRYDEALEEHAIAIAILKQLVKQQRHLNLTDALAASYSNRGNTYHKLERQEEALEDYALAIAIWTRLVEQEGHDELANNLATGHRNRGITLNSLGRHDEALKDCEKAVAVKKRLVEKEGHEELAEDLAACLLGRGNTYQALARYNEALVDYANAIAVQTRLVEQESREELADDLAASYGNRGLAYQSLERYDEALKDYAKAIAIQTRLVEQESRGELADDLAASYGNRGLAYQSLGRYDEALKDYAEAIAIGTRLVEQEGHEEYAATLAISHSNRGTIYFALGHHDNALAEYTKAIHIQTRLVAKGSDEVAENLAYSLIGRSFAHDANAPLEGLPDLQRASDLLEASSTPRTLRRTALLQLIEPRLKNALK